MFLFIYTYYFPVVHLNMISTVEFCVCSLLDLESKRRDLILSNIKLLLSSVPRRSKTKTIYRLKKKKDWCFRGKFVMKQGKHSRRWKHAQNITALSYKDHRWKIAANIQCAMKNNWYIIVLDITNPLLKCALQ